MIYKDICVKKEFNDKVKWQKVGTLKQTDDGKQFIEINIFPNQDFFVFDQKPREQQQQPQYQEPRPDAPPTY